MGSLQYIKTGKARRYAGKVNSSLNEKLINVEWGEYQLGNLFEISNTLSFNKDKLCGGSDYDYVTRTSENQGILQETGFVNSENINSPEVWSLGLLQMDFFYRSKPWYAGQFVRKIIPKIELTDSAVLYLSTLLNKQKPNLLKVLVRDIDKVFKDSKIQLPIKSKELGAKKKNINFEFMQSFIAELEAERITELEAERITELEAYLVATGLKDYTLTQEEEQVLAEVEDGEVEWREHIIKDLFEVNPSKAYKINDKEILIKNGKTPYVSNQSQENGYIGWSHLSPLNPSNVITLSDTWQSERTIFYQPSEFIGKSHLQVMHPRNDKFQKLALFFVISSFRKAITDLNYDYGTKFNRTKINATKIQLPTKNNQPDYETMETLISAIQKIVIKDVVLYTDKKIAATKSVVN